MKRTGICASRRLAFGLLLASGLAASVTAQAAVLVVKNLTNDTMGICYMVGGLGNVCFTTNEVPPYGTVTTNIGTSCLQRWKVTRARDGQVVVSRAAGTVCGDRQLLIRPDGPGFSLDGP